MPSYTTWAQPAATCSHSNSQISTPANNAATQSLIAIQTKAHAFSLLTQRRPKFKFTGENKKVDFESFIHNFQSLTNIPGADDAMRLSELPHWFCGTAALIIDRFVTDADAAHGLSAAIKALKKEFGKRKVTAKQMLHDLLSGEKLPDREYQQIKTFLLQLEKCYKIATETKRQDSFDLPEMINEVIRAKLPHLAPKWAKKVSDAEQDADDDESPNLSFTQFLAFAKKQNSVAQTTGDILKPPETAKSALKPNARIAAHQVETGANRPNRKRPSSAPDVTRHTAGMAAHRPHTCPFCQGAPHHPNNCRKFAALSNPDKTKLVRDLRLCINCLSNTHLMANCPSRSRCNVPQCGAPHHTLLHGIRINAAPNNAHQNAQGQAPPS